MENFKKRIWTAVIFALSPVTAFWLMQLMIGGYPWQYSFKVLLGNYVCMAFAFFFLCALTNHIALASILLHIAAWLWGVANGFLMQFRGNPILPWDFTALDTAMAVAGNYHYTPTVMMIVGLVILIALCVVIKKLCIAGEIRFTKDSAKFRLSALFLGAVCLVCTCSQTFLEACGIEADVWDQAASYQGTGAAASFALNTKFMDVDKPDNYSDAHVEEIMATVEPQKTELHGEEISKPNIIAIMNESWADFEDFGNLKLSESVTDYIKSLDGIYSHAYASVFGAGTSASEFEFLTGNTMAFLPSGSIPYQQYILHDTESLASILKNEGYQCIAMHPGERTSWQRNSAYPKLGFDTFICGEDMHVELSDEHGYVGDDSSFSEIIYQYEHRDTTKPFFMFNVTIQNHGSYTDENYPAEVWLTDDKGKYPQAEQYLTLANKTDQAFKILVDYFKACDTPTIIMMFGDHQPSVETEFLEKAYGVAMDDMTMEQYMGKFKVPFVIWANYDLPEAEIPYTSLNFLSQYLLEYAGINTTPYGEFLCQTGKTIPALTFAGYFDSEGNAYSHLERNGFDELINSYQVIQYKNLFEADRKAAQ